MIDAFEDHCWQDVVPAETLELYKAYRRDVFVGPHAAVVAIDLYEMAYQGGALPVKEVSRTYPSSCGENAWNAILPTRRLFEAARATSVPIFYSTNETRADAKPTAVRATNRRSSKISDELYAIRGDFAPQDGDVIIRKTRASAFFGTPLVAHLNGLGIQSIIIFGESTSGCLRASAVDAYSNGYHVTIAEECCYDRSIISHKVNLFDLHHKYADVMKTDDIIAHLASKTLVGSA